VNKIEESTLSADDGEPEMLDFWAFLKEKSQYFENKALPKHI
jgi:hypothetical protein